MPKIRFEFEATDWIAFCFEIVHAQREWHGSQQRRWFNVQTAQWPTRTILNAQTLILFIILPHLFHNPKQSTAKNEKPSWTNSMEYTTMSPDIYLLNYLIGIHIDIVILNRHTCRSQILSPASNTKNYILLGWVVHRTIKARTLILINRWRRNSI